MSCGIELCGIELCGIEKAIVLEQGSSMEIVLIAVVNQDGLEEITPILSGSNDGW